RKGLPIVQVKFRCAQICACAESLRAKQMCRHLNIGAYLSLMLAPKGLFKLATVVVLLPYGLIPGRVP
ncbi:unnamed protein product, partial [Staurois parvus]